MTKAQENIENILSEVYGVGVAVAPVECIVWAADRIENTEQAKKELKRANRIRAKWGKQPAYVPYGHRLF